jgi:hypothetical protein
LHPMFHRRHTRYSSCMCCSPVGRGCLVVPLLRLSHEGAFLRCLRAALLNSSFRPLSIGIRR